MTTPTPNRLVEISAIALLVALGWQWSGNAAEQDEPLGTLPALIAAHRADATSHCRSLVLRAVDRAIEFGPGPDAVTPKRQGRYEVTGRASVGTSPDVETRLDYTCIVDVSADDPVQVRIVEHSF